MRLKIAVIGAGLSGLTAANYLKNAGHNVHVFEKARGPGGRSSTRRSDFGRLDHGTQYFTVRDDGFQEFLNSPALHGCTAIWDANFAIWKDDQFESDPKASDTRYVGAPAMNEICKALSKQVNVYAGVRIEKLIKNNNLWSLLDSESKKIEGDFDIVISSAPPMQTHDLYLGHSEIAQDVKPLDMNPCFTFMALYDRHVSLPYDGIRFQDHPVFGWAANNHSKPGRDVTSAIVIQSNFDWVKPRVDDDLDDLKEEIVIEAQDLFDMDLSGASYSAGHRWLYSSPVKSHDAGFYMDDAAGLAACGDWCLGPRFECAYLSGSKLAQHLIDRQK